MRYARIQDGIVAELVDLPDTVLELDEDGAEGAYSERPSTVADFFAAELAAAFVPAGPEVAQGWALDAGSFSPPPPRAPSQAAYAAAVQMHIESVARSRGYDSALSLASYLGSTILTWAAEAGVFVAWRDEVWTAAYALLGAWQASGADPAAAPSVDAVLAALPEIAWPG
jgi:hypothetical protein